MLETLSQLGDLRRDVDILESQMIVTNGCFDLFHPGHLHLLKTMFLMGTPYSKVIVLLNSDASIRALKGPGRPVQNQRIRADMLGALKFVDGVYVFNTKRCNKELDALRPHIYVKGDDRKLEDLDPAERAVLKKHGTKIVLLPRLGDFSTTSQISKGR